MNLNDEYLNGQYAKEVLNNPAYKEAWERIREGLINAMNQSPMGDEKTHTKLVMALQITNKIQKQLETTMETGKLAEIQLNEKKRFFGLAA